jgi:hypothetical protein
MKNPSTGYQQKPIVIVGMTHLQDSLVPVYKEQQLVPLAIEGYPESLDLCARLGQLLIVPV